MTTSLTACLAIDPGNEFSAYVLLQPDAILASGKVPNATMLNILLAGVPGAKHLAIETMKPRGMPTAFEEMQTQLFAGRCIQAWGLEFTQMFRHDVKIHICGRGNAKDTNIRQALIDKFGGAAAIGGKRCKRCGGKGWRGRDHDACDSCYGSTWTLPPGPLVDITEDRWSALAIGVTWWEKHAATEVVLAAPVIV